MTAPPAAERSIPALANEARAGGEAVRSSLANRGAPSSRMLHLRPSPQLLPPHPPVLGAGDPRVESQEEGTRTLGFPTLGVWEDLVGYPRFSL